MLRVGSDQDGTRYPSTRHASPDLLAAALARRLRLGLTSAAHVRSGQCSDSIQILSILSILSDRIQQNLYFHRSFGLDCSKLNKYLQIVFIDCWGPLAERVHRPIAGLGRPPCLAGK